MNQRRVRVWHSNQHGMRVLPRSESPNQRRMRVLPRSESRRGSSTPQNLAYRVGRVKRHEKCSQI